MKRKFFSAILAGLLVLGGMIGALGATPPPDADLEMLKSLPDGTGALVVDIQKVLNSEIWAFALSKAGANNPTNDINLALAKVGMKLVDLNSVAIGFSTSGVDMNNFSGVVRGNFNQTALLDTIKQISKAKLTQEQYKNFDIYTVEKTPEPAPAATPAAMSKPADTAPPAAPRKSDQAKAKKKHGGGFGNLPRWT